MIPQMPCWCSNVQLAHKPSQLILLQTLNPDENVQFLISGLLPQSFAPKLLMRKVSNTFSIISKNDSCCSVNWLAWTDHPSLPISNEGNKATLALELRVFRIFSGSFLAARRMGGAKFCTSSTGTLSVYTYIKQGH